MLYEVITNMQFVVKTIKQSFTVNNLAVKAYDSQSFKMQYLSGIVYTADCGVEKQIESIVEVSKDGEKQKLNWEHAADGRITSYNVCYTKLLRVLATSLK